jgi:hypothetical protein
VHGAEAVVYDGGVRSGGLYRGRWSRLRRWLCCYDRRWTTLRSCSSEIALLHTCNEDSRYTEQHSISIMYNSSHTASRRTTPVNDSIHVPDGLGVPSATKVTPTSSVRHMHTWHSRAHATLLHLHTPLDAERRSMHESNSTAYRTRKRRRSHETSPRIAF